MGVGRTPLPPQNSTLVFVRLEAAHVLQNKRRDQSDERNSKQRRRDRAFHQRHRIAKTNRQGPSQLTLSERTEDQPHHHGRYREIVPPHQEAEQPKPVSMVSSTTD